ncbi:TonB-dependent receptor plug domain-containing protein [Endothiovibrio diazotrophicus]
MKTVIRFERSPLIAALGGWLIAFPVHADSGEIPESLADFYGGQALITLATGREMPVANAPAIATVITAEEIHAMGASDLDQVLETVAGLHVSHHYIGNSPIYVVRGIYSEHNPEVLMLVNGIPITSAYQGNRADIWGGMPVNAIARIEVIRGPGSALYGADAFAGVINVVTKRARDIDGTEVGARLGSDDTRGTWLLHGDEWHGVEVALMMEASTTDGSGPIVEADGLSATPYSLAPDPVNNRGDSLDLRLDLAKGNWRLRSAYEGRRDLGTGLGIIQVLDPAGELNRDRFTADLTYHNPDFAPNWEVDAALSHMYYGKWTNLYVVPSGPNALIARPAHYETRAGVDLSAFYTGFSGHRLRLGSGYVYNDLYRVEEKVGPPGALVETTDTAAVYMPEVHRKDLFLVLQDEWAFAPDWQLTAGARYDDYSDFGSTINPRVSLVWATDYDLSTKLLYGRAFRAPSFLEQYAQNNPVRIGNASLEPPTIDTVELGWDYHPTSRLRGGLSFFVYEMKNRIDYLPPGAAPATAQNHGGQRGHGIELEGKWRAGDTLTLSGNYAYQKSTDELTDQDPGYAPHHQVYLRADWAIDPRWSLDTQLSWIGERPRAAGDLRDPLDGYTVVDLSLRHQGPRNRWEVALTVNNLFDVDAREPSLSAYDGSVSIPNDQPRPERQLSVAFQYRF